MIKHIELKQEHAVVSEHLPLPTPSAFRLLPGECVLSISPPPQDLPIAEVQVVVVSYPAGVLTFKGWARLAGTDAWDVPVKGRVLRNQLTFLSLIDSEEVQEV